MPLLKKVLLFTAHEIGEMLPVEESRNLSEKASRLRGRRRGLLRMSLRTIDRTGIRHDVMFTTSLADAIHRRPAVKACLNSLIVVDPCRPVRRCLPHFTC